MWATLEASEASTDECFLQVLPWAQPQFNLRIPFFYLAGRVGVLVHFSMEPGRSFCFPPPPSYPPPFAVHSPSPSLDRLDIEWQEDGEDSHVETLSLSKPSPPPLPRRLLHPLPPSSFRVHGHAVTLSLNDIPLSFVQPVPIPNTVSRRAREQTVSCYPPSFIPSASPIVLAETIGQTGTEPRMAWAKERGSTRIVPLDSSPNGEILPALHSPIHPHGVAELDKSPLKKGTTSWRRKLSRFLNLQTNKNAI